MRVEPRNNSIFESFDSRSYNRPSKSSGSTFENSRSTSILSKVTLGENLSTVYAMQATFLLYSNLLAYNVEFTRGKTL